MFRLWGKLFKDGRLLQDMVYEDGSASLSRTQKVFAGLRQLCLSFDLQEPLWLDANIREFQQRDKTHFRQDNFIEQIEFDYLEIHVIEEDNTL